MVQVHPSPLKKDIVMDTRYSAHRDGESITVPPIEELCLILKDKFLRQEETIKRLIEENKRLKSEAYKDEELFKMRSEFDKMRKEYYNGFPVSDEEKKKIDEWKKSRYKGNITTIGGRFVYKFFPTSIGTSGVITDGEDEFEFRELG